MKLNKEDRGAIEFVAEEIALEKGWLTCSRIQMASGSRLATMYCNFYNKPMGDMWVDADASYGDSAFYIEDFRTTKRNLRLTLLALFAEAYDSDDFKETL